MTEHEHHVEQDSELTVVDLSGQFHIANEAAERANDYRSQSLREYVKALVGLKGQRVLASYELFAVINGFPNQQRGPQAEFVRFAEPLMRSEVEVVIYDAGYTGDVNFRFPVGVAGVDTVAELSSAEKVVIHKVMDDTPKQ